MKEGNLEIQFMKKNVVLKKVLAETQFRFDFLPDV